MQHLMEVAVLAPLDHLDPRVNPVCPVTMALLVRRARVEMQESVRLETSAVAKVASNARPDHQDPPVPKEALDLQERPAMTDNPEVPAKEDNQDHQAPPAIPAPMATQAARVRQASQDRMVLAARPCLAQKDLLDLPAQPVNLVRTANLRPQVPQARPAQRALPANPVNLEAMDSPAVQATQALQVATPLTVPVPRALNQLVALNLRHRLQHQLHKQVMAVNRSHQLHRPRRLQHQLPKHMLPPRAPPMLAAIVVALVSWPARWRLVNK